MRKQVFFGSNKFGNPVIHNQKAMDDAMLSFGDKPFQITLEKRIKQRSTLQNGFYWSNVVKSQIECFKEYWGEVYTPAQIHEWNKATFWAETIIVNNEPLSKPATSTQYSTTEWEERVDQIRHFFIEKFDWTIGYPETQSEIDLNF